MNLMINCMVMMKYFSRSTIAYSFVIEKGRIVCILEGCKKFSGKTPLDDDSENGSTLNSEASKIYNHNKTLLAQK